MRATKIFTEANLIKIRVLADNGSGALQIAHAIGSTPGSVRNMCGKMKIKAGPLERLWLWRRAVHNFQRFRGEFFELDRHARQRDISLQTLAALFLETIAKDNLFDAVIDEAPCKPMPFQPTRANR